jgi:hypothetical protein
MIDKKGQMEVNICNQSNTAVEIRCIDGRADVEVLEELPRAVDVTQSAEDDKWIEAAQKLTDLCIDELVNEFVIFPYLHRVEHSIHTRLYELLHNKDHFKGFSPLSEMKQLTQYIHKEWPECKPRPGKNDRRGNFDMAILHPGQICACNPDDFSKGLLKPPVAIEIGLNYGLDHLLRDDNKLRNSNIKDGYLVHLVRLSDRATDQVVKCQVDMARSVIRDLKSKIRPNKIAFALVGGKKKYIKLLSDPEITDYEPKPYI